MVILVVCGKLMFGINIYYCSYINEYMKYFIKKKGMDLW